MGDQRIFMQFQQAIMLGASVRHDADAEAGCSGESITSCSAVDVQVATTVALRVCKASEPIARL